MKRTYFPKVPSRAALWQLDEDDAQPVGGLSAKLYIINYVDTSWAPPGEAEHAWTVEANRRRIGYLPLDTPEEELKALAIAMWRLG